MPPVRLADGDQDRPLRRVPRLHHAIRSARAPARSRSGIKCPKCLEGDLAERRTKRGKSFWGCVRYPACDFSTWNRPVPETCPELRLGRDGEEDQQGRGRDPDLPQVRHKIVVIDAEEVARRERHRGRRRPRRLRSGLGPGRARRPGHAARDAPGQCRPRPITPIVSPSWSAATPSNRSRLTNAHGLLKAELRDWAACCCPVPTWRGCRPVRRSRSTATHFSQDVHDRVTAHPQHRRCAARRSPSFPRRASWRPVPSPLIGWRSRVGAALGGTALAFYDAIAPIVSGRIARPRAALRAVPIRQGRGRRLPQRAARPGRLRVVHRGTASRRTSSAAHDFDKVPYFEGCLPVEEMARRGRETLRFGPMKPVGLPDPPKWPGAARGGAAPPRGPRGADVEPGRIPDPAEDPGTAAGLPA